jgi:hypothetical protein
MESGGDTRQTTWKRINKDKSGRTYKVIPTGPSKENELQWSLNSRIWRRELCERDGADVGLIRLCRKSPVVELVRISSGEEKYTCIAEWSIQNCCPQYAPMERMSNACVFQKRRKGSGSIQESFGFVHVLEKEEGVCSREKIPIGGHNKWNGTGHVEAVAEQPISRYVIR